MAPQSSAPPPPPSGGSAKYVVILLILLLGAGGIWFALSSQKEKAAPAPPPPKAAQRETSLADDSLVIPDPEEELPEEEPEEEPEEPAEDKPKRAARPARDPWACKGDLPPAEIRKVINASRSTIRACYERRLKNVNMLQGSVNMQVKVGPDGSVVATRVRGTLNDADVRACVQGQARQWKFPAPTGGCVVFEAPYNFTPKN